jgi:hypothetical protein
LPGEGLMALRWRYTGFNVHSKARAQTKREVERVGKYMIRPLLSLQRLSFDDKGDKISYRPNFKKNLKKMLPQ